MSAMADLAEFHLGVEHSAHELFRVAKIFRGLPGLGAYQPVSSGKGGSGSPKRTFQSLLDEILQVHKAIITYCFVMIIVVSVQALASQTLLWCDEYPFASTLEGGQANGSSLMLVPATEQMYQGGMLSAFYAACSVVANDPYDGMFGVVPGTPSTFWQCK